MNYFFTADTHFGHGNIIKYCNRPWLRDGDLDEKGNWVSQEIQKTRGDEMNAALMRNWNERVKPEDVVFVVGDFCFKRTNQSIRSKTWEEQLNGKIIFIRGNHDKNNSTKTIIESLIIQIGGRHIYLVHRPQDADLNYSLNFVGHIHEKWKVRRKGNSILYNVGVDVNKFMPITFNEIIKTIKRWARHN